MSGRRPPARRAAPSGPGRAGGPGGPGDGAATRRPAAPA